MTKKVEGLDPWQIEAWIMRLGSFPVQRIEHCDRSGGYRKRAAHVLVLENGKYALVSEIGCSCYSAADAEIEIFPNKRVVLSKFSVWKKEHPEN